MISEKDVVINLFLILILSGLVGFERERHDRPAGLRTHILVGVGSTVLMMISISMNQLYVESDAGRIAAQVVSGIGFLGAGTIIKEGFSVKGLTTAASLWGMAAIGLAVGGKYYFLSIISTLLIIITLFLLNLIEKRIIAKKHKVLKCRIMDKPGVLGEISTVLGNKKGNIKDLNIEKGSKNEKELMIEFTFKVFDKKQVQSITGELLKIEELIELDWDNI